MRTPAIITHAPSSLPATSADVVSRAATSITSSSSEPTNLEAIPANNSKSLTGDIISVPVTLSAEKIMTHAKISAHEELPSAISENIRSEEFMSATSVADNNFFDWLCDLAEVSEEFMSATSVADNNFFDSGYAIWPS